MVGLSDIEDNEMDFDDMVEEEHQAEPSSARKMVAKLQSAADWYSETVHPYIDVVKKPIGYVLWCAVTFAVIAGLPTAKAVFSDPYTELSSILLEAEMLEAERMANSRVKRA